MIHLWPLNGSILSIRLLLCLGHFRRVFNHLLKSELWWTYSALDRFSLNKIPFGSFWLSHINNREPLAINQVTSLVSRDINSQFDFNYHFFMRLASKEFLSYPYQHTQWLRVCAWTQRYHQSTSKVIKDCVAAASNQKIFRRLWNAQFINFFNCIKKPETVFVNCFITQLIVKAISSVLHNLFPLSLVCWKLFRMACSPTP